jgi:hypothetical protein
VRTSEGACVIAVMPAPSPRINPTTWFAIVIGVGPAVSAFFAEVCAVCGKWVTPKAHFGW